MEKSGTAVKGTTLVNPRPELLETGCGMSRELDAYAAGTEAARQAVGSIRDNPLSFLLVFASVAYDLPALLAGIADTAGDGVPVIGATTAGEICGGPQARSVVVTALASTCMSVRAAVGRDVSKNWVRSFNECAESEAVGKYFNGNAGSLGEMAREGRSAFAMMFSPGNTKRADSMAYEILEAFNGRTGGCYPLVGGCSADDWGMEENYVLYGRHAYKDSLLMAFFETSLRFGIGLDHGFIPSSGMFTVGRCENHEVLELNGKPAVEVLAKAVGFKQKDLPGQHITLSVAMPFGSLAPLGNYTISVASFSTPRGGIRFSQPHDEGATISMMDYKPAYLANAGRHALRRALLRGGITKPAAVLIFSSAYRSRITSYDPVDEIENVKSLVPGIPVTGFYCFGEQAVLDDGISRHNNGTVAVLALCGELTQMALAARMRSAYERMIDIQHETAHRLSLAESVEDAFRVLLDGLCSTGEFDSGGAYLYREDVKILQLVYHSGFGEEFVRATHSYGDESRKRPAGPGGKTDISRFRFISRETGPPFDIYIKENIKALAAVPLRHEGKIIGSLNMASHAVESTSDMVKALLETMASHAASALQRILAYEQIRSSRNNLDMLFNTIEDFIFVVDSAGLIIEANKTVEIRLGYGRGEIKAMAVADFHPPERRGEAADIIRDMLLGIRDVCEIPLQTKDGNLIPVETRIVRGAWCGSEVLFGVSRDMTERNRMEDRLRKSMREYDELVATIPVGIFKLKMLKSGEPAFVYVSPRWCEIMGLERDDVLRDPYLAINQIHPDVMDEFLKLNYNAYEKLEPFTWEGPVVIRGETRCIHIESRPAPLEEGGDAWDGIQYDVTDRKKIEDGRRELLEEKDLLLREVHHRVKNNMQIIASLISLQKNIIADVSSAAAFADLQGRVMTMSAVHDMLYAAGSAEGVKIGDYLRKITSALTGTCGINRLTVEVVHEVDGALELRPDRAVPCGLIINELVTNSLKYAFQDREGGMIRVGVRRENGTIRMNYSDDGPGLPPGVDPGSARTMGLLLVQMLVNQLRGELSIIKGKGLALEIVFPA